MATKQARFLHEGERVRWICTITNPEAVSPEHFGKAVDGTVRGSFRPPYLNDVEIYFPELGINVSFLAGVEFEVLP